MISLCMIARDEDWCLDRCLSSASAYVDEIVLVDTGSTDRTVEIARRYGATVLYRPWDEDFSAPRNLAAEHATGDWILALDADEVLAPGAGPAIRSACLRAGPVVAIDLRLLNARSIYVEPDAVIRSSDGVAMSVRRVVRRGAKWIRRVHESPVIDGPAAKLAAYIVHYGYAGDAPTRLRRTGRNLELLRRAFADDPRDVYIAGFLVGEYLLRYDESSSKDNALLVQAAQVVESSLPLLRANADSVRLIANWGLLGAALGDADETLTAAGFGERLLPAHPDWAYLEGVGHYYVMMQSSGEVRAKHRALARRAIRECLRRLDNMESGVVLAATKERCGVALERINHPPPEPISSHNVESET